MWRDGEPIPLTQLYLRNLFSNNNTVPEVLIMGARWCKKFTVFMRHVEPLITRKGVKSSKVDVAPGPMNWRMVSSVMLRRNCWKWVISKRSRRQRAISRGWFSPILLAPGCCRWCWCTSEGHSRSALSLSNSCWLFCNPGSRFCIFMSRSKLFSWFFLPVPQLWSAEIAACEDSGVIFFGAVSRAECTCRMNPFSLQ